MRTRTAKFAAAAVAVAALGVGSAATAGATTYFCDGSGERVAVTNKTGRVDRNGNGYICHYQWWSMSNPDHKHTWYYDDSSMP